jgi:hypothetical protein
VKKIGVIARGLCFLAATAALADLDECELHGRWEGRGAPGVYAEFFGAGLGRLGNAGGVSFFRYRCGGDPAAITFRFGAGIERTNQIVVTASELRLVAADGTTNVYERTATTWSACQTNLWRLSAAKALYAAGNESRAPSSLADLYPEYLPVLPACPSDGAYALGDETKLPACSVEGHAIAD